MDNVNPTRDHTVLRLLKAGGGLALTFGGMVWLASVVFFVRDAVETPGKVVRLESGRHIRRILEPRFYDVVFEFKDQRGRLHVASTSIRLPSYARFHDGETVAVVYPANHPEEARLKIFDALYLLPCLVSALGMGIFAHHLFRRAGT